LWRHGFVDNLVKNKLPKNTTEYNFLRKPGWNEGDPIHLPNLLLHLYQSPGDCGDDEYFLLRLPKRKDKRLEYERLTMKNNTNIGYGVHLQQGPAGMRFQIVAAIIAGILAVSCSAITDKVRADSQLSFPWSICSFLWGIFILFLNLWKEWLEKRYSIT
jgi:hypothetical protein